MKNIGVILASGTGSRFGAKMPKQFIKLAGKPIIQYTLEAFQKASCIDEIIVVTGDSYTDFVSGIVNDNKINKVTKIISGGKERYESSWSAIQCIDQEECNIIFHDAVRPFVSQRIINDCVEALNEWNAVDVVVDPTDTIVKVKGSTIMSIPDRRFLGRGQTPQAFKKSVITEAYNRFLAEPNRVASDDCGIVLKYLPTEPVYIVKGEESNFKITHQQDIYLADNIIRDGVLAQVENDREKIEQCMSDKVIVIFGGSSGIGQSILVKAKEFGANVYSFSRVNGCDISQKEDINKALEKVLELENRIDCVINTVGVLIKKPISFMTDEDIINNCNVNYVGAINVARQSYEHLKSSQGMLVNFTSSSFTRGRANYSLYSSSKAAIVNFTQALADEWQSSNIKVNCINPERTDTPMRRKSFGIEPPESLLTAEQVADTTLSLIASNYTGQIISVRK
ncbi:bifunctional cytidylyltransferase/SDR family oxidoreductase [Scandinavium manionii]|uniref:bifunctional cytidylyltransferase/SDR family oxidoreductase n=1 Tax=Scandinavium manionii TaxID=2926520 RepID=UPI0021664D38|nr:bifunctional cytidylyltransferase/SDR family oxidoreductase [Scandinavium manionii]MCS2168275.1 bifunctional cytidylyltransferase/SDR family oxidoreductase [Scandinavium manionii]